MSEKLSVKVPRKVSAKAPRMSRKGVSADIEGLSMPQGPNPKKGIRPTFAKGGAAKKGY